MLMWWIQAEGPASATKWEVIAAAAGVIATNVSTAVMNHRKGRKRDVRDAGMLGRIERKVDRLSTEFSRVAETVTDLDHIVRGVDQNNGLRGRLETIERERQAEMRSQIDRLHDKHG